MLEDINFLYKDAIKYVKENVSLGEYTHIYISKEKVDINTIKDCCNKNITFKNAEQNLKGYLVFVNPCTFANWAHECCYCFIYNNNIIINEKGMWMPNNIQDMNLIWNGENWVPTKEELKYMNIIGENMSALIRNCLVTNIEDYIENMHDENDIQKIKDNPEEIKLIKEILALELNIFIITHSLLDWNTKESLNDIREEKLKEYKSKFNKEFKCFNEQFLRRV